MCPSVTLIICTKIHQLDIKNLGYSHQEMQFSSVSISAPSSTYLNSLLGSNEIGHDFRLMATPNVSKLRHLKSQLLAPPQSPETNNDHNDNEDEESWEVRAFAKDTASGMGTTWPPRSYTCSFCRREFKSAQALGGHMNVHRRDRARLHQTQKSLMKISNPNTSYPSSSSTSGGSTLLIPTQEFLVNGGLCLLYQLRNDNPNPLDRNTILSVSPYPEADNSPSFIAAFPQAKYPYSVTKNNHQISSKPSASLNRYYHKNSLTNEGHDSGQHNTGDLDLELRLGHGPTTPS